MNVKREVVTLPDGRERTRLTFENGRKTYWWHVQHRAREITSEKHRALIDAAIERLK
ncbi:hypothetical protein BcepF1.053 [Burkholderia phage BcepF1]|uniref:Uncharacterized protein n=1 Tax=Burkholderia phage BcepF1 TaxID=2886897 RepID=A1YZV7_9CAUD|nr:hypothetical protein BcepF1.053 [Burkholderia phage BcepF1]ABL96784.1 hypothetical protein BcepF1.053 [Burkholderia phage BcepF1]